MHAFSKFPYSSSLQEHLLSPDSVFLYQNPFPPVNIMEKDGDIRIHALLPGLELRDLHIVLRERTVILEGDIACCQGIFHRKERFSGFFRRIVCLGRPLDPDRKRVSLCHGVLEIFLPGAYRN